MTYDIIIAGAGITGLSTAYSILKAQPEKKILVLEKETGVCMHQTGNNSGVIHSGIYYRPGSLKALNCISGYHKLLSFATEHSIPFELCRKLIVAVNPAEVGRLDDLYDRGIQNGLKGLKKLKAEEISAYEPHVQGVAGIVVPQTGIIDYLLVGKKLAELIQKDYQGTILTSCHVLKVAEEKDLVVVHTSAGEFTAKLFINTCGLFSDRVALTSMEKLPVRIIPFRGEYYKLRPEKEYLVKNLVYPVPDPQFPFLGVHFTRMMKGGVEAGPNAVLAFKREGYKKTDFSWSDTADSFAWKGFRKVMWQYAGMGVGEFYRSFNKAAFTKALQRLLPEIGQNDLVPGGAGIRAQACDRNGKLVDDFLFAEGRRSIHVLNAPSPAATACLAIGEYVAGKVMRM